MFTTNVTIKYAILHMTLILFNLRHQNHEKTILTKALYIYTKFPFLVEFCFIGLYELNHSIFKYKRENFFPFKSDHK